MQLFKILFLSLPLVSISAFSVADERPFSDPLVDLNYRYEVAGYCGLVDQTVHEGYITQVQRLAESDNLSADVQLQASGKGWQAAHKEWLNRGLGGFKRWCRNEGQRYAGELRNQAE